MQYNTLNIFTAKKERSGPSKNKGLDRSKNSYKVATLSKIRNAIVPAPSKGDKFVYKEIVSVGIDPDVKTSKPNAQDLALMKNAVLKKFIANGFTNSKMNSFEKQVISAFKTLPKEQQENELNVLWNFQP